MGGNALTKTYTRRYNKAEYLNLADEMVSELIWEFGTEHISAIPAYRDKESFGDLDILYSTNDGNSLTVEQIKDFFQPNQIVRNSEVISFDFKEFQVDLIHVDSSHYSYARDYFSWNDTGNLIGKLAHQLGLKHGHKGLVLPLRDGNNKFADVCITLDHRKTLELLGLDVDKFYSGFKNLDEIFKFVSDSKFYSPESYKLENLNAIAKMRDKKRDTYNKFLQFGETYTGPVYDRSNDKTKYLEHIFAFFPDAYQQYIDAISGLALQQAAKLKFNGEIVLSLTGKKNKELGRFMGVLRNDFYFRNENLLYLSQAQINAKIINAHKSNL